MRTRHHQIGRKLETLVAVLCVFAIAGTAATIALSDTGGVGTTMVPSNFDKAAYLALRPMTPPLNDKVGPIHCRLHGLTLAYCNATFTGGQPLKLRVYVQYIVAKDAYKVWARIRGVHGP
jgi:hypothetical protein